MALLYTQQCTAQPPSLLPPRCSVLEGDAGHDPMISLAVRCVIWAEGSHETETPLPYSATSGCSTTRHFSLRACRGHSWP